MAAPDTVRVKLSSEEAGAISLTPVVVREMPFGELLEEIAAVHGKDRVRISATLKRGSVAGGATRFRWQPVELSEAELAFVLARLPDDEPARRFEGGRCTQALFTGPGVRIAVLREVADSRRLFRRTSFWSALAQIAGASQYVAYSYRERAGTEAYGARTPHSPGSVRGHRVHRDAIAGPNSASALYARESSYSFVDLRRPRVLMMTGDPSNPKRSRILLATIRSTEKCNSWYVSMKSTKVGGRTEGCVM